MWGNRIRYRNIKCVISEIEKIQETFGQVKIFIADDIFLMNKKRVYEFCTEIERRKLYFSWSCLSRVDNVSENLLKRMKESGCKEISYGCESGSNKILEICNKNISTKDIINAVRITKKVGISCKAG
jgi:anaerobic magnesium-protoporphyrin IX monomethyl ester cyclase